MRELSVADVTIRDLLAAVAGGEEVRLVDGERSVAVVLPTVDREEANADWSLVDWVREFQDAYAESGRRLTKAEVDSWRDRSHGPEPLDFR
ncbi:MAG: hypothetical protein AAF805_12125 [Planctomycetota bacterium]